MQQGDQYNLPIKIKSGTTYITPSNCTDVRIKVGETMKSYEDEEITFDSTTNEWLYPLTETMTFAMDDFVSVQVAVKSGTDFIYSKVHELRVGDSIIKVVWS